MKTVRCVAALSIVFWSVLFSQQAKVLAQEPGASDTSPTQYLIYPKDSHNKDQTDAISKKLGAIENEVLAANCFGVVAWLASLTPDQVKDFKTNPAIAGVVEDLELETTLETPVQEEPSRRMRRSATDRTIHSVSKRDEILVKDDKAPPELRLVSQPQSQPDLDLDKLQNYVYDDKGGQGVTVYVIDSGVNLNHPEFSTMPGTKRWLFPGETKSAKQTKDDASPFGHGSCVISKVVGKTFGVAKKADLVVVKLKTRQGSFKVSHSLKTLIEVCSDARTEKLDKKVVSISWGIERIKDQANLDAMRNAMRDLIRDDFIVVLASGNEGKKHKDVNMYPQLLAKDIPELILVGSISAMDGQEVLSSQGGPLVSIWAPGQATQKEGIQCAEGTGTGIQKLRGTSFACPAVAGLAAYFLSLDKLPPGSPDIHEKGSVAKNMKKFLEDNAYSRKKGPKALWNLQDSDVEAGSTSAGEPWCVHGASPRQNLAYCQCGDNYASLYPVATGTDNPCPYTAPPGPTVAMDALTAPEVAPPAEPTPPPPPAPSRGPLNCNPAKTLDQDIHGEMVDSLADHICTIYKDRSMKSTDAKLTLDDDMEIQVSNSLVGLNYAFTVEWAPGCSSTPDTLNVGEPIQGLKCEDILKDNYHKCNNQGVGGSTEVGCLRYAFNPTTL